MDNAPLPPAPDPAPDPTANPSPLERTFLHLPRIGVRTEQKLWREGVNTWDDLEAARREPPDLFGVPPNPLLDAVTASRRALEDGDSGYFAARLPPREHYRIAATYPEQTLFLDIETTGLSLYYDTITVIGCACGDRYACHIVGAQDEYDEALRELVDQATCIVTFNGTVFDLKFLAKQTPELHFPTAHVDLRYLVRRASLKGGQKEVEAALGIRRPDDILDVDGAQAVILWYEYISGNTDAGRQLVRYNHADVEGMKGLLDATVARIGDAGDSPLPCAAPTRFADVTSRIRFDDSPGAVRVPPYVVPSDTVMNYERLTQPIRGPLRIVGIDLTGSEARPSGWCALEGCNATTRTIRSDTEMIDAIADWAPHLVSIDSPLSLPRGRHDVGDDDPTRDEFGIMRQCERTLKRRGINVYPCLLPSMQRLTARGIHLASTLRALGVPVIESYPGAAQDIMNIPRKRSGVELLKDGLRLFGIKGDYLDQQVTHDELDAITSAIVGLYFWAGRFEALGDEHEDYLIIPDLERTNCSPRIVGISGPIAAGKTTAARFLQDVGFEYARYSQVLEDLAAQEGHTPDRHTLQAIGHRVHRHPGQRWLNTSLLSRAGPDHADLVIDGLRWPEDHAFWVERFGPAFRHVHISAPDDIRRARYTANGNPAAEFDNATDHAVEAAVCRLGALSHFQLRNDRLIDDVRRDLGDHIDARLHELPP